MSTEWVLFGLLGYMIGLVMGRMWKVAVEKGTRDVGSMTEREEEQTIEEDEEEEWGATNWDEDNKEDEWPKSRVELEKEEEQRVKERKEEAEKKEVETQMQRAARERANAIRFWKCFRCGEQGHRVRECKGEMKCWKCGKSGHRQEVCKKREISLG